MSKQMSEQAAKEKAKARDDYCCRYCGMTREEHKEENGRDLHAHHIIKSNDGGQDLPRNLITVCRDCHTTLEETQADALSRIKESELGVDPERHEEVVEQRDKLMMRVQELERHIRDPAFYTVIFNNPSVKGEVVTELVGHRSTVTADGSKAMEEYQDWGSQIRRTGMSVKSDVIEGWLDDDNALDRYSGCNLRITEREELQR